MGVTKVEIYKDDGKTLSRSLTSTQDLSAVCEIFVGGFSQGPEAPEFVLKMRAFGQPSEGSVPFEKALNAPIFRYKGMPFASSGLQKSLARLEAP